MSQWLMTQSLMSKWSIVKGMMSQGMTSLLFASKASVRRSGRTAMLAALLAMATLAPSHAFAQARAWLDRDRIAVGETTTLNVETDESGTRAPDYSALRQDFEITGNTSSRQMELTNGSLRSRVLYAVALQPKRDGMLTVPALRVGSQTTAPLSLTVSAAEPTRAGGPVFIEAEADDTEPYVQQAVGYTLKLFYSRPLLAGQLDQDAPDGASLQRLGSDQQYTQLLDGTRYTVVERHFLLIPERSGALTIPGARFQGRSGGGFFDDVFGDGQRALSANGAPRFLSVRPAPANAPQPWLPLRSLALRYLSAPQSARVGEAVEVTVEATADGATGTQLPDLTLPAIDGAQVFADPVQVNERVEGGRPKVTATRKFSIVPSRAGTLRIVGPRLRWWDVRAARVRTASLPDITLVAAPGAAGTGTRAPSANGQPAAGAASTGANTKDDSADGPGIPGVAQVLKPWPLAAAGFALLWLLTLVWALQRRGSPAGDQPGRGAALPAAAQAPRVGVRALRQALDTGDLGDIADVLCAMAQPPVRDLDALLPCLDNHGQRVAIAQLQRARWGDGDAATSRAALRTAFASGPDWRTTPVSPASPLPPLYPPA